MITRIEIDGFKTFKDFAVDLAPFQVIIGTNGCGKSNLLDAIQLISLLASGDVATALQHGRGEAHEAFTAIPDGSRVNLIKIAVEMLVNILVVDDWGGDANLSNPRLRYELEIGL